jgi:2-dehydropantoate 2-reductase
MLGGEIEPEEARMARIAIVGVGAIGGVLAAQLGSTGRHEITLCTRRPLQHLIVTTPEGVVSVTAANRIAPAAAEPVDWVLVATKAYDSEGAAAWLRPLALQGAPVAVVQNGVEHRERFRSLLAADRTLPVIIDCPVERRADGSVLQRGTARMYVEEGPLGRDFALLFAGSNAKVDLTADFLTAAWRKLCFNAAGAVSALVMQPAGVLRDEALADVALDLVVECVAVGRAEGARLDDTLGQQVLDGYRAQPPDSVNSMLADRLAGRPMEIDARNGVIVRKGEKHRIPTPSNRMAVALLHALARATAAAADPRQPETKP